MHVDPKEDVIEALLPFWDCAKNVFRFSNFELTPTLEKIVGFIGFGVRLHRMEKKTFKRFGRKLNNKGDFETWKEHRRFAFMVAFLGTNIFPRRGGKINICLAGVVNVLIEKENYTIVPMILADIYLVLAVCQKGKCFFEGCKILLQLWIVEHLYRPHTVARLIQDWSDYITSHAKRVEKYRGVQPYVPLRVLRQLGRRQILPITEDMKDFVSEVGPKVPLPKGLAQNIWDGCIVMGIGTMVKERYTGDTHPEYSIWLEKQPPLKALRAELELARAALTQQQVEFEEERAKATQRETLLQGQVNLATIRGSQIAELAVYRLADCAAQMGLDYQEMNHERFLAEVPKFAEYLTSSLQDIYQSVGGHLRLQSPQVSRLECKHDD
ncbi:hypothetical protein KY285_008076 [Solanum tuberosum]|nr:hypothetical protein KY285_008076 [Solanum tuberosum]